MSRYEQEIVLVVDDNPANLAVLFNQLEGAEYKVLIAEDGESALQQLEYLIPDIILMDVVMPNMDGLETCKRIKANPAYKDIPVIFMTAYNKSHSQAKGFAVGAVDYLNKPIDAEEMLARLKTHLTIGRLYKSLHQQNQQLQQRNKELQHLNQITQLFNSTLDTNTVIKTVLNETANLLDISATSFWLVDRTTDDMVCYSATGPNSNMIIGTRKNPKYGFAGWVVRHEQSLIVTDITTDSRFTKRVEQTQKIIFQSALCVPLKVRGDTIGAITFVDEDTYRFTDDDLKFIEPIAAAAAVAVENAQLFSTLDRELQKQQYLQIFLEMSEQKYRSVVENGNDGILVIINGWIEYCNPQMADMLGYHQEDFMALPLVEHTVSEDQEKIKQFQIVELDNKNLFDKPNVEITLVHRTGRLIDVEFNITPIEYDSRPALLAYIRDISERKNMENQLRQQNKELDAFARTVAKGLKTPLGIVVNYADYLVDYASHINTIELQEIAKYVQTAGRETLSTIEELLLLAGVRKQTVPITPINMADVVYHVLQRLDTDIIKYQAEICLPNKWPTANGYAPWLEEVWLNYIMNGLQNGGSPPKLEIGTASQANGQVKFWLRDNGLGIAPEYQTEIFYEFSTLQEDKQGQYGLGLVLVRRIIEKLGGQVGVESEIGQGSIFSFTLPII